MSGIEPQPFDPDDMSGVDPQPFRLFLATASGDLMTDLGFGQDYLELDCSEVTGTLGSLSLSGMLLHEVTDAGERTDVSYTIDPFTIQPVPLPAALLLLLSALGGLGLMGWRRERLGAVRGLSDHAVHVSGLPKVDFVPSPQSNRPVLSDTGH